MNSAKGLGANMARACSDQEDASGVSSVHQTTSAQQALRRERLPSVTLKHHMNMEGATGFPRSGSGTTRTRKARLARAD
ncbi:MAG: hypothetical protein EBU08_11915 [Micrococcales bacterium]|nr:hypothetical protein [Micrococcales bacterium]